MNLRVNLFILLVLAVLPSAGYALDNQGLTSNLEVGKPVEGAIGLDFAVTNNNLGNVFWVDPSTNALSSYSAVGLGGKYYLNEKLRLAATAEFFFNSWTYANKDQQTLYGGALQTELDYILLNSGSIDIYAGPTVEVGFVGGNYNSYSNSTTTTQSGQTYLVGAILGAEYFVQSQFSIGTSIPIEYRAVVTSTTNTNALVGPSETSGFVLGSVVLDLTYYL